MVKIKYSNLQKKIAGADGEVIDIYINKGAVIYANKMELFDGVVFSDGVGAFCRTYSYTVKTG